MTVSLTRDNGEVDFDASGSADGDGSIAAYHFYFDISNPSGADSNGTVARATHRYTQVDVYYASVNVFDNFGALGYSQDLEVKVIA